MKMLGGLEAILQCGSGGGESGGEGGVRENQNTLMVNECGGTVERDALLFPLSGRLHTTATTSAKKQKLVWASPRSEWAQYYATAF